MNSAKLKRLLEAPWFPETLATQTCYERTQDDCDGNLLKGRVSVIIDQQGDVWMEAMDIETHSRASLRFRTYMGGGMSMRTRQALLFLCEAIRLDNEECPQQLLSSRSNAAGGLPVNPNSAPPPSVEHVKQMEREPGDSEDKGSAPEATHVRQNALYPDSLTPEQRKRYDATMAEISPALEKMCKELDDCTRLSAADFAITINAR